MLVAQSPATENRYEAAINPARHCDHGSLPLQLAKHNFSNGRFNIRSGGCRVNT
jgi:hypothetical protein